MQENTFEMNVGKVSFVVEAKILERGKESAEEKLKNIMIKDLIAKDEAMVSKKLAKTVDFSGLGASNRSFKNSSKMA